MNNIPFEIGMWVLGGLLTIIGGMLLWIFGQINKKQDKLGERIEVKIDQLTEKIDANEVQNHADHRIVDKRLSNIESRLSVVESRIENIIQRNSDRDEE